MMNTNAVITRNRLQQIAPSVFATDHKAGLSSKYVFVPTSEIVTQMERMGWLVVKAQEMRARGDNMGYQKHLIRFRMYDEKIGQKLEVGDTVCEIILTNSHNGRSAFIFNFGMFRCVCTNQMVVSESAFDAIHVRHAGYDAQQLLNVTGQVVEKAPEIIGKINDFKGIQLSDRETMAFGNAAKRLRFANPDVVETERVLMPHRTADQGNDLWKVFNRTQENLIKGHVSYVEPNTETGRPQRKTTKEVKAIDSNMKLNQALWTLGEEMARIKKEQA